LEAYIRREEGNPATIFMAIVEKRSKEHIGNIKIHGIDQIHRHAQVSLIIGEKQHWGKGYATEAIRLIIDFALNTLNLHKLFACIYAPNEGSIAAFRKAGFVEEGLRKEHRFFDGRYIDEVDMAIIKPTHGEQQW
jgi:RimJ/RimL family protein N-acetyltransferase